MGRTAGCSFPCCPGRRSLRPALRLQLPGGRPQRRRPRLGPQRLSPLPRRDPAATESACALVPLAQGGSASTVGQDAGARELDAVQERVHRESTALDPVREAVAAPAPVVGRRIDCLRRATFDYLSLDAAARQRAVFERRGDCGPDLGDRRHLGGILELGHGAPSSGRWAGGCLLLSVLLHQLYKLSRSSRATASPAVRTPSLASRRASHSATGRDSHPGCSALPKCSPANARRRGRRARSRHRGRAARPPSRAADLRPERGRGARAPAWPAAHPRGPGQAMLSTSRSRSENPRSVRPSPATTASPRPVRTPIAISYSTPAAP
jgi:hypothetical protein